MTLVASGTLHLKGSSAAPTQSIEYELEGNYTGDFSLTTASSLASFTLPTSMSDFYNYSAGSTVVVDFSNSTTDVGTQSAIYQHKYQSLVITGRGASDVITLTMNVDFNEQLGSIVGNVWWSKNSTTSWTLLQNFTSTPPSPISKSMTLIDNNDVVRVKMEIDGAGKVVEGDITSTLTGGSFTTGSGTITASGTLIFQLSVFQDLS